MTTSFDDLGQSVKNQNPKKSNIFEKMWLVLLVYGKEANAVACEGGGF